MPNHSAVAVANEFLKLRSSDTWPRQMFIQKLVYIAQGWNLAINGEPLVDEAAEAWDNGPVFRSLWDHIRDVGYRGPHCTLTSPFNGDVIEERLSPSEEAIIRHVWGKYGEMSASKLSAMTHEPNTPWWKAYFGRGRNAELNNKDIREHYTALAMAGRGGNR